MSAPLLHSGATVLCTHGGRAAPLAVPNPRVKVSGQAVVVQPLPYSVAGCPNPGSSGGPCVTAQWTSAATRVRSNGAPVLLKTSRAICAPTGAPLHVAATQIRVTGI